MTRKIELQMVAAINANKDWKSGNTSVETTEGVSKVFLHGNHIATIGEDFMELFDGGWQSNTTKSRLNALCDAFCVAGEGVFQSKFQWFFRKFTGQMGDQKVFTTIEFESGMLLN